MHDCSAPIYRYRQCSSPCNGARTREINRASPTTAVAGDYMSQRIRLSKPDKFVCSAGCLHWKGQHDNKSRDLAKHRRVVRVGRQPEFVPCRDSVIDSPMHVRELQWIEPVRAMRRHAGRDHLTFLDSAARDQLLGRYSYLAWDPFNTYLVAEGQASCNGAGLEGHSMGHSSHSSRLVSARAPPGHPAVSGRRGRIPRYQAPGWRGNWSG